MAKCIDCVKYLPNKDNCSDDREQGGKELHNDEFTCDGFIANKKSVKTMNRKEAVIYLMDNPGKEIRMIVNSLGTKVDRKYSVYNPQIIAEKGYLENYNDSLDIFMGSENDKAEFEIVRELRKMSFGEAYYIAFEKYCSGSHINVRNVNTGELINSNNIGKAEYSHGLWTVEGVYE